MANRVDGYCGREVECRCLLNLFRTGSGSGLEFNWKLIAAFEVVSFGHLACQHAHAQHTVFSKHTQWRIALLALPKALRGQRGKNPNLTSACSTNQIDPIEDGSKSPGFAAAPTLALEIDRKYPDLSASEQRTVQKTRAKRKIKQKERNPNMLQKPEHNKVCWWFGCSDCWTKETTIARQT
ncbi:Uncharacterized protein Fot_16683 [Forsythia ovata]|uniref:Uncharacterized protein n=1 Tax=Forsythia ovata TaxID=205694 RepID=A0ABD1VD98_9LAMI